MSSRTRACGLAALLAGLAMTTAAAVARAAAAPEVEANGETLLGVFDGAHPQVASFKGVPFAVAPVGELRWREPQPPTPRRGRQDARTFAAGCYQDDYNIDWYRDVGKAFGAPPPTFANPAFSEDCLYLNVWTPRLAPDARLPVMVWIHGGANRGGWSFEPNYQGARLAARGDVVVVTIAYRLGVFGFFGHPELTGAQAAANFGLLDQIAGLRWVRDNIAQFGGDRDNITVFGESAGGSNIGYLVSLPAARDLFRRAISQSGGFQMQDHLRLADAEQTGTALSKAIPGTPGLAALRRMPSWEIWDAALRGLPSQDYSPVVDGVTVLETPAAAYARHGIAHDLLIGTNQDEWYMYFDDAPDGLRKDVAAQPPNVRAALEARAAQEPDVRSGRDKVFTFVNMVCPAYLMAGAARAAGRSAWVYRFTRVRPGPGGATLGSYHGAEIPYVFDTHDSWLSRDATDDALTTRMIDFWANFARYGNPNGSHGDAWPPFNPSSPRVMELGDRIGPLPAADNELCRRWAADLYPGWQESPPHAR